MMPSEVCHFIFFSRGSMGREKSDKPLPAGTARPNTFLRGSSKDLLDNQSQEEQRREMLETVKQLTGGVDAERASTEADRSKTRELGEGSGTQDRPMTDFKLRSKIQTQDWRGDSAIKNTGFSSRGPIFSF